MIDFKRVTLNDKETYENHLKSCPERGCEYSFANLYLWGRQTIAEFDGNIAFFSQFNRRSVYPFPIGSGDKKAVLDAVIEDSKKRGIPCRITGLTAADRETLKELYPGRFRIHSDRDAHDYVYSIDDLADLRGKRYHRKRNHLKRFRKTNPNYICEPLCDGNTDNAKKMVEMWYSERLEADPNADFCMERCAVSKAFRDRDALGLEGYVLRLGGEVAAITFGSRMRDDTFDIHFEKASSHVDGAYTAINCEFAKYIRDKYPDVKFFNREEDMGIEGLRKAKSSYYPHHMVEKWWACLLEDGYEY